MVLWFCSVVFLLAPVEYTQYTFWLPLTVPFSVINIFCAGLPIKIIIKKM